VHDEILLDIQRGVIRFVIPLLHLVKPVTHRSNPMLIFSGRDYVIQPLVNKRLKDIYSVKFTIGIHHPDVDIVFGDREKLSCNIPNVVGTILAGIGVRRSVIRTPERTHPNDVVGVLADDHDRRKLVTPTVLFSFRCALYPFHLVAIAIVGNVRHIQSDFRTSPKP